MGKTQEYTFTLQKRDNQKIMYLLNHPNRLIKLMPTRGIGPLTY
jgi:hypothetical protein